MGADRNTKKHPVHGGERNGDGGEKSGETLCSSTSCYSNPDSALKYGHHVDSLKKWSSSNPARANERRREGPGEEEEVHGEGPLTVSQRGILACECGRRVRGSEGTTSPGELDDPRVNGDRWDLVSS